MKSVLLCGCGNIGFRHLQALCAMPDPVAITIVEPNVAAHERIAGFFDPIANSRGFRFDLRQEAPVASPRQHFDLVVIATSADTRRAVVDAVLAQCDVGVMILEKVLFQHHHDLDAVAAALSARGISGFVNCARRYFPGYHDLLAAATSARPLDITIQGAAFGLASNGIHLIDLAEYLNGAELVALEGSGLLPGSIAAKRAGCVEVFGTLTGKLSNGARLRITCDNTDAMALQVSVQGTSFAAQIDELARQITLNDAAQTTFETKFVSETWQIYHEALTTGQCGLTPYADSVRQHHLFLSALSAHLGLDAASACPIS